MTVLLYILLGVVSIAWKRDPSVASKHRGIAASRHCTAPSVEGTHASRGIAALRGTVCRRNPYISRHRGIAASRDTVCIAALRGRQERSCVRRRDPRDPYVSRHRSRQERSWVERRDPYVSRHRGIAALHGGQEGSCVGKRDPNVSRHRGIAASRHCAVNTRDHV